MTPLQVDEAVRAIRQASRGCRDALESLEGALAHALQDDHDAAMDAELHIASERLSNVERAIALLLLRRRAPMRVVVPAPPSPGVPDGIATAGVAGVRPPLLSREELVVWLGHLGRGADITAESVKLVGRQAARMLARDAR